LNLGDICICKVFYSQLLRRLSGSREALNLMGIAILIDPEVRQYRTLLEVLQYGAPLRKRNR